MKAFAGILFAFAFIALIATQAYPETETWVAAGVFGLAGAGLLFLSRKK